MTDLPSQEGERSGRRSVATGLVWLCPTALLIAEVLLAGHVRPLTVVVSLAAAFALLTRRLWGRVATVVLALAGALSHATLVPADSRWLAIIALDLAVVAAVVLSGRPGTEH
ncbi:DUF7144 family membrane protein [Amycolatopsis pithecellobii]|uniref:DUF7144 domain-containing protein n=1 Tax=Amycolatopsis pithecellobii TaxID=664692 RepID=A0A6N7YQA7_9PSEU|nr:hypothetical protein [Amycolatopsis pithecellobii]MTD55195.1 hypothetical protein [Amycolatopsis pithecellobii]